VNIIVTADVGSTFTKLTAIDVEGECTIGYAKAFTTIEHDVMEGFDLAKKELLKLTGTIKINKMAAASSAAGGLAMIAVGLVPDLTVQAARLAAANSGAKILKTYAFELSQTEIDEIITLSPDMILLSGGTDGGNKEVIIHNGQKIALSGLHCALVVAGNKSATDDLKACLASYPGEVIFCPNVLPEINQLNIEPAKAAIRQLFIANIIEAKGLNKLQNLLDLEIIPTPATVLAAAELLSRGHGKTPGVGDLLLFDVGGATTDVYSMAIGDPTKQNVIMRGLPQPYAKRTVEGDLGLRYSLEPLVNAASIDYLSDRLEAISQEIKAHSPTNLIASLAASSLAANLPANLTANLVATNAPNANNAHNTPNSYENSSPWAKFITSWVAKCTQDPSAVPEVNTPEKWLDDELARECVRQSIARHCGNLEPFWTFLGQNFVQTGKDLSSVAAIIGTGGPIINASAFDYVLAGAKYEVNDLLLLKPLNPTYRVDKQYLISAMGTLSRFEPEVALKIMVNTLDF
jgi:uncharacterized protein (TIGR01319 family)